MSLVHEIICESVKTRDMDSLNKALHIVFPDKMKDTELIIHEYDGFVPRLFGDDNHIELMLPEDMDEIVENAVVDAIENGTLFDDADHVKNAATYIAMTKFPMNGMANRGIEEPKAIKHALGSVVGAMNSEGRFGADETDIEVGKDFVKDIVDNGNEDNVQDLVTAYIDARDVGNLPNEFRRSLKDLNKEIDNIKSVKPEDSISSSDLDEGLDMKKVKEMDSIGDDGVDDVEECGCQCVKEEGEMEPGETPSTPTSTTEYTITDVEDENLISFLENALIEEGNLHDDDEIIQEGFFRRPKKLKPIPRDVVAYITVELNAVSTSNDQAMIAGYTCSKLELVDFYITCLDTNDDRYIVPHSRQYLVQMQQDLNNLLTRILQLRPINKSDRMWKVNVTLPEGR